MPNATAAHEPLIAAQRWRRGGAAIRGGSAVAAPQASAADVVVGSSKRGKSVSIRDSCCDEATLQFAGLRRQRKRENPSMRVAAACAAALLLCGANPRVRRHGLRAQRRLRDDLGHRHGHRQVTSDDHGRRSKPRGIAIAARRQAACTSATRPATASSSSTSPARRAGARRSSATRPKAIYVSPDGRWLAAAIEENNQVLIVDTATLTIARARDDEGQESRARRLESRRQVDLRQRRGGRQRRHRRRRERRGRQVDHGRRPAARHRLSARRQPRVRRRRARRHRQRVRHRDARGRRADQGRHARPTASSCIPTASASSSPPAATARCR